MRISDALIRLIGARDTSCPNEASVLAYFENRLSSTSRAQIERHFANCIDCQEVLAFLGRETHATVPPTTPEAVSEQTTRVLGYIRNDELGRSKQTEKPPYAPGFRISYPKLATVGLVMSVIAITSIYFFISGPSPAEAGMEAIKLAVKNKRYTEPRVSGGFAHSRYAGTIRGADDSSANLHFDRAESKVRTAAQETSDVNAQLVLARSYLARGTSKGANQALTLLDQLSRRGVETPETLNDTGVAHLRLSNYDEAIVSFTRALAKSPRYDEALFNRALVHQILHRDAEARNDWQQFIDQSTDENWRNEARARLDSLNTSTDR
jgi:Flp pilus assembly protein TadD